MARALLWAALTCGSGGAREEEKAEASPRAAGFGGEEDKEAPMAVAGFGSKRPRTTASNLSLCPCHLSFPHTVDEQSSSALVPSLMLHA